MGEEYGISNLDVYPNPSRDIFNVSFTSEKAQDLTVRVMNMLGEMIKEGVQRHKGQYIKSIDLNQYNKEFTYLKS